MLALNVVPKCILAMTPILSPEAKLELDFIANEKNVMQLHISGNPYVYNFFSIEELRKIIKSIAIKNENTIKVEQRFSLITEKSGND